jgi:hypothetical protein
MRLPLKSTVATTGEPGMSINERPLDLHRMAAEGCNDRRNIA